MIVHFILPVVMEHLKIRGPVRRASCWVLMAACGATGTRRLLLHPALLAGERSLSFCQALVIFFAFTLYLPLAVFLRRVL